VIGKSIANRPYMYLPLKGDTNDYGTGGNNPSNTSVTTTTGQFGESNGAYEWDATNDYLDWSSTIGNTIAGYLNAGATVLGFFEFTGMAASSDFYRIFHQYQGSGTPSFLWNFSTFSLTYAGQFYPTNGSVTTASNYYDTSWHLYGFRTADSSGNLQIDFLKDGVFDTKTTTTGNCNTGSTHALRLGTRLGSSQSFKGKCHDFKVYNTRLSNGQLKLIEIQKGRIRA